MRELSDPLRHRRRLLASGPGSDRKQATVAAESLLSNLTSNVIASLGRLNATVRNGLEVAPLGGLGPAGGGPRAAGESTRGAPPRAECFAIGPRPTAVPPTSLRSSPSVARSTSTKPSRVAHSATSRST